MNRKHSLIALVVLLLAASALQAQDSTKAAPPVPPSVLIENQSGQRIQVFDGTYGQLVSLMPGERRLVALRGTGTRTIKVRSVQWSTETSPELFESNRSWQLVVNLDGRLELNLRGSRAPGS